MNTQAVPSTKMDEQLKLSVDTIRFVSCRETAVGTNDAKLAKAMVDHMLGYPTVTNVLITDITAGKDCILSSTGAFKNGWWVVTPCPQCDTRLSGVFAVTYELWDGAELVAITTSRSLADFMAKATGLVVCKVEVH